MKFRKKISFCTIVLKILLITLVCSFPQTFSSNSYIKGKNLPLALSADVFPFATQSFQHEINGGNWNVFQEPIYDTFNFPDIEYPLISKPKTDLLNGKSKAPFYCKSRPNYSPMIDSLKGLKSTSNINALNVPPEFSSAPSYRDIANFPEVEYPMSASEMWKPNYWNSQRTDYSYSNINTDYCSNPMLNEYFPELNNPMRNFATNLKPTQSTFSTKSYSDSNKNLISQKNKGSYNNVFMDENRKKNTTFFLDSSKVGDSKTLTSLSFNPGSTDNKRTSNFSYDVCPKDTKILNKTKMLLESDVLSDLPSKSEMLVNACADIFKDEIKSVLKTMADNIILNNLNKEKVMAPSELTAHTSNILESNTNCNSLNIYEEFTSPDLLKNRRSQDLNDFTKYNKDFIIPIVDLESKLTSTDLLIDSYADKFHDEMTSILKSNADDFILRTFENSKNHVLETNINRSGLKDYTKEEHLKTHYNEHLRKDFSKLNYEPILPVKDVDIHTHADKLHNEMTLMVNSKADNILLNKFENSNKHNKPSIVTQKFTDHNNKVPDKPKPSPPKGLVNLERGDVNRANLKTVEDDNKRTEYKKDPIKSSKTQENITPSTTQAPRFPDISTNDFKSDKEQEVCKESDNKLNNKTSTSFLSGKEENDIPPEDLTNTEIELEEDFTTDSYPENDGGELSFYALSTVAPQTSTVDLLWRDTNVIEPDKTVYPDELEDYFIRN